MQVLQQILQVATWRHLGGVSGFYLFVCLKRRIMAIKVNILQQLDNFSLKVDIDQKTNKKNLEDSADASPFVIVT